MDIVQLVALAVGILTLIWHQQRSIAALRAEFKADMAALRAEFKADIAELKGDIAELRLVVIGNGERLARIEGYLGIGMPEEAAATAAGAGVRPGASAPAEA